MTNRFIAIYDPLSSLLESVIQEKGLYYIDQSQYQLSQDPTGSESGNGLSFDNYARNYWIFHNIDYKNWVENNDNAYMYPRILIFCKPEPVDLEEAAFHISRTQIRDNKSTGLFLRFFYSSTKSSKNANLHAHAVWTLLRQVIDNHPVHQREFFEEFLDSLRTPMDIIERAKVEAQKDPAKMTAELMALSSPGNLWNALCQALRKPSKLKLDSAGNINSGSSNASSVRSLTVILDIDNLYIEQWPELIASIRNTTKSLRRDYFVVKWLITNPPNFGDLGIRQSEVLVEYDNERQGTCKPCHSHKIL